MSKFSKYISEISLISDRVQEVLADKENKLKDKVQQNDLVRHRKVEEKELAMEDELSSFRKRTDKLKAKRLKDIQDAETEINKSISDIEEQEKQAEISYNLDANGNGVHNHKDFFKLLIIIFVLVTLSLAIMWSVCFYDISWEKNSTQRYLEEVLTDYENQRFSCPSERFGYECSVEIHTDVNKKGKSIDNGLGGLLINARDIRWHTDNGFFDSQAEYYISVRFHFADGKRVMSSGDSFKLPDGACGIIKNLKNLYVHDVDIYIPYKVMDLVQDEANDINVVVSLHRYDEKKKRDSKVETRVTHVGNCKLVKLGDKVSGNLDDETLKKFIWSKYDELCGDALLGEDYFPLWCEFYSWAKGWNERFESKEYLKKLSSWAESLSTNGTANCYIVSAPGIYSFPAREGNTKTQVKDISNVQVLWQNSVNSSEPVEVVSDNVFYNDGHIIFYSNYAKEGNCVVAAKNKNGEILWSWHIWVTDEPKGQKYNNNAGIMMDRNLGATSANPEEDSQCFGLLYQWGRKDPFLINSYLWQTIASDSSTGTIEYSISHPTTFITSDGDWLYRKEDLWGFRRKSKYDPCPVGWKVPEGGDGTIWGSAVGYSSGWGKDVRTDNLFSAESVYYPYSPYILGNNGKLGNAYYRRDKFECWEMVQTIYDHAAIWTTLREFAFYYSTRDGISHRNFHAAYGLPVRCVKERQKS